MKQIIRSLDSDSPLMGKAMPEDILVSINGHPINDVLDYKFHGYDANALIVLQKPDGKWKMIYLEKPEGKELGLNFSDYLMDQARACANHCIFCFIDQLPPNMRETLYFKDDDARLSFLTGNYITLTNISEREIQRILDLHVSPVNISVHATDPVLRAKMLGNKRGANGYSIMKRLAAGGISMNCQIVCCPGINDGEVLSRSMEDLEKLYPAVSSVSIVPVGLSRYRSGLYPLKNHTAETARDVISRVSAVSKRCFETHGRRVFYCSDEFYIKAKQPLPPDAAYDDYPQLENGVGMMRLLITEFEAALSLSEPEFSSQTGGHSNGFSIATGVSAAPFISKLLMTAQEKCATLEGQVYPIENHFFGTDINVAGLITGGDLIAQLQGKPLGQRLLISQNMLRQGEQVFLDDLTVSEVENALQTKVVAIPQDGGVLLDAMTGRCLS